MHLLRLPLMTMFNEDLNSQIDFLETMLQKSEQVREVLARVPQLGLPNWYLGAGAVAQTVWNDLHGFPLETGISDYDVVYFDPDTSYEAEDAHIQQAKRDLGSLSAQVEVRNEARVHLWYEQKFGKKIKPYISTEDAINTWPTTATAIGVRYDPSGKFFVYAPYGLNDLLGMIVRPNKEQVAQVVYEAKARRWQKVWPGLNILPWEHVNTFLE
jgi:uncharacterized protein